MHGKVLLNTVFSVLIILLINSCSSERGAYSLLDREKALLNGMPYWEDIIFFFPTNVDALEKDRIMIPRVTLKEKPPRRTFYDEEGTPIEWAEKEAPEKFAGYQVQVEYLSGGTTELKEYMFTVQLILSEAVVSKLVAQYKSEENLEMHVINGFRLYRSDPEVTQKTTAFFNSEICIDALLHSSDPENHFRMFVRFLETINKERLLKLLKKTEKEIQRLPAREDDGVDRL